MIERDEMEGGGKSRKGKGKRKEVVTVLKVKNIEKCKDFEDVLTFLLLFTNRSVISIG